MHWLALGLVALALSVGCGGGGGGGTGGAGTPTYRISGTVSGDTAAGVTITLSGASTATTTTAANGTFAFTGLANGSYTVGASKSGFAFDPVSRSVVVNGADVAAQNFAATSAASTYTISGAVSGATDVLVTLTGPQGGSATTSGAFSFPGLVAGTYTLTATKAGYTFTNTPQTVTVTSNQTAATFVGTLITYTVSGHVAGASAVSVALAATGFTTVTTTTDGNGDYQFTGVAPRSYTVTPSKAGYSFTPASATATVTSADVTVPDFAATLVTYTIAGTVTGDVAANVTVTLSGDADMVVTTAAGGAYTFSGVPPGSYVITPSRAGYDFTPASLPAVVASSNVTGKNFTSSLQPVPTYTLSGTVSGPWAEGVRVSIAGGPFTTTDANGSYSFTGLTAGSYTVTPSLSGYAFSPPSATVTIASASRTQHFTQASAVPAYAISGDLTYGGSKSGRAYVWALPSGCTDAECAAGGTSVPLAGPATVAYRIRGLPAGSYTVRAALDAIGYGVANATNPSGEASATIGTADATANVVLTDPPAATPPAPASIDAFPGPGGAFVLWDGPWGANGELAASYLVSWGTDPAASNGGTATRPAYDNAYKFVTGLTDGVAYYFKVKSVSGASESAWVTTGPVTIGAVPGARTVSGTVTGATPATGSLVVLVINDTTARWTRIANPSASQAFTITGVPDGAYEVFAVHDKNADGVADDEPSAEDVVTVAANTTKNLALSTAAYEARVTTNHWRHADNPAWDGYHLRFEIREDQKRPVAATIISGPHLRLPADLPREWQLQLWQGISGTPAVGDAYRVKLTFSDDTTETTTLLVTGVLGAGAFARNLAAVTTGAGSPAVPLFTWQAPASPPAQYTYRAGLWGNGAGWWWPDNEAGAPSSTTQVLYNADGYAQTPTLGTGSYTWYITVVDANGNEAQMQKNYVVP